MATIPISKYSFRQIIFSVIIAALSVLFQIFVPQYASTALPFIVLFFFTLSMFTMYVLLRPVKSNDNKKMISRYLVSRIVKFSSCILFVLIYVLINKSDSIKFGIAFLIIYFAYAIFEVFVLKKELKN